MFDPWNGSQLDSSYLKLRYHEFGKRGKNGEPAVQPEPIARVEYPSKIDSDHV